VDDGPAALVERADVTSNTYDDWVLDHAWLAVPMQAFVATMLQSFGEFPRRRLRRVLDHDLWRSWRAQH
jgi:hypothetical protein